MKPLKLETLSNWEKLYKFLSRNLPNDPAFRIGFLDSLSPVEQELVAIGLRIHLIIHGFFFRTIDLIDERRARVRLSPIREKRIRKNADTKRKTVRDAYYLIPTNRISAVELLDCARIAVFEYGKKTGKSGLLEKYKLDV